MLCQIGLNPTLSLKLVVLYVRRYLGISGHKKNQIDRVTGNFQKSLIFENVLKIPKYRPNIRPSKITFSNYGSSATPSFVR